jgi:RNA polymerase sigma-70 factor (ECF subfamily)
MEREEVPTNSPIVERTDEQLAIQVQNGNAESFGVLMERYEPKLMRYGHKFLSENEDITDIVQEVFINTYRNIRSFDAAQRFSPWIYRIAHNGFVNAIRKKSRNPFFTVDFDSFVSHPVAPEQSHTQAETNEMKEMVEKGLEKLASKYREILVLYYLEELSYKEIADVLQVPTGTVGIRLKRAKDALQKVYKSMNITYEF